MDNKSKVNIVKLNRRFYAKLYTKSLKEQSKLVFDLQKSKELPLEDKLLLVYETIFIVAIIVLIMTNIEL